MAPQFYLLFGVFLVLAVWYSVKLPLGEGVDEGLHFQYIQYVATERQLPVQGVDTPARVWMAHHPPLYYLLGAGLVSFFDLSDSQSVMRPNPHFVWSESGERGWNVVLPDPMDRFPWAGTRLAVHTLRFLNLLFGVLAVYFVVQILSHLFPGRPWSVFAASALFVFNPNFIYMTSSVHHDSLLVAVFLAGIAWSVSVLNRPLSLSRILTGSGLTAAAILVKVSGIGLAAVVGLALLLRKQRPTDWANRWLSLLSVGVAVLVFSGWWFLRNLQLYGDLLGSGQYREAYAHQAREGTATLALYAADFLGQLYRTAWGAFGFVHILLPERLILGLWIVAAVLLLGCIPVAVRAWQRNRPDPIIQTAWLLAAVAFLSLFAIYSILSVSMAGMGQARYLMPGAVIAGAALVAGANGYVNWRLERLTALILAAGMLALAVVAPARFVWPKYRLPPSPSPVALALATPIQVSFSGGIQLLAVEVSSAVVLPGQGLDVTTYWQAEETVSETVDPVADVSLVSGDGMLIGAVSFWPETASIPSVWGDRIIANRQSFFIPTDVSGGSLLVQLQMRDDATGAALQANGVDAPALTLAQLPALGAVVEFSETELPREHRQEIFGGVLQLAAVQVPELVQPGAVLPVSLFWRVLADIPADYTVFVHILDANDQIVAQLDRPPGGGVSPTSSWQPGQILLDTYPVPLPRDLPAGEYRVRMGLYTWPDLTRQVVSVDGVDVGEFSVVARFSIQQQE